MVEKRKAADGGKGETGESKKVKREEPTRSSSRIAKITKETTETAKKKSDAKNGITRASPGEKKVETRGRPKKTEQEKKTTQNNNEKKRGRPKKTREVEKVAKKIKRIGETRGRPRKTEDEKKSKTITKSHEKKVETRGRPRKVASEKKTIEDTEEDKTKENVEEKKTKSRGRPRKTEEEKKIKKSSAKKGGARGRPRKVMKESEKEEDKTTESEKDDEKGTDSKQLKRSAKKDEEDFRIVVSFNDLPTDVLTFGSGEVGQLGLQTIRERKKPDTLRALTNKHILKLEVGGLHNFVIEQKNKEDPTDTRVWSWGCNDNKILGRDTPSTENEEDDKAERPEIIPDFEGKHIIDITTGEYHTAALAADGTLYLWGSYKEQDGFLGYTKDQKTSQALPIVYPPTKEYKFKQIASGHNHTLALTQDGNILIWGCQVAWDDKSQYLVPRHIRHPTNAAPVARIVAGGYSNFIITEDDKVFAWGLNNSGQLGIGNNQNTDTIVETELSNKNIISIASAMLHTIALSSSGKVYSFGAGEYGQLGLGYISDIRLKLGYSTNKKNKPTQFTVPQEISFFNDQDKVKQIHGVNNHTVAVTESGKLYAWGFGACGQIGNATDEDALIPFLVEGKQTKGRKIYSAGAGAQHTTLTCSNKLADGS